MIPRGYGRAHRRDGICVGVDLCCLVRSLGVKAEGKGMAVSMFRGQPILGERQREGSSGFL